MGLISKEVEVTLNSSNIIYYKNLNYILPIKINKDGKLRVPRGTKLLVKIEHLPNGSHAIVKAICDNPDCKEEFEIPYREYLNNNSYNILVCGNKCVKYKKDKILNIKYNNNDLNDNDLGYYTIKDNRLKYVDNYLKKYKTLDNYTNIPEGKKLISFISNYKEKPLDLAIELGYKKEDILTLKKIDIYNDFNSLKSLIEDFIIINNRFPTWTELHDKLDIPQNIIDFYGGINSIKNKMEYIDEFDYIDDSGYKNKSSYEYIVAQFFIKNNLSYMREEHPFPKEEGQYRSDFSFITKENKKIYVEVWGYDENSKGSIGINYNLSKKIKLSLYNKYNLNLISIPAKLFLKSYDEIQNELKSIFEPIFNLQLVKFDNVFINMPNQLTDEEIINIISKYMIEDNILPSKNILEKNKLENIYREIIKRYKNYSIFAEKYNKTVRLKHGFWTKERIITMFHNLILEYSRFPTIIEVESFGFKNKEYIGMISAITKYFGKFSDFKLFYNNNYK